MPAEFFFRAVVDEARPGVPEKSVVRRAVQGKPCRSEAPPALLKTEERQP